MTKAIILHSDPVIRTAIASAADYQGITALVAGSIDDIFALGPPSEPVCIIADARADNDLLPELHRLPPVIFLSSDPELRAAVTAIKAGASDYLSWPCEPLELIAAIERSLAERSRWDNSPRAACPILGDSPTMRGLLDTIQRIGPSAATVLISGESGTGKTLIANALHAASPRAAAPLITLNCGSLPPGMIETELFGYGSADETHARSRPGLLEAADGGTLFLDDIDELELQTQTRLLRVLESGELRRIGSSICRPVSIRLITSTQRDLPLLVARRSFREDLYLRLSVVKISVPPLRQRPEDILLLAESVLARLSMRLGREPSRLDGEARKALLGYHWPGNVRELESAIERALVLSDSPVIPAHLLSLNSAEGFPPAATPAARLASAAPAVNATQTTIEDYFVSFVLTYQDQFSETELASRLGISRKSLWERRQRLNIPRSRLPSRLTPLGNNPLREA
jgi:DNA-binding NtrC family response regulator